MLFKIILWLLVLTFPCHNLISMSRENKSAFSNIKKVELIDKDYRTIGVIPFENLTGDDHYFYLGKTIQKFLSNNLSILDKIKIFTNDYFIPEKFKTNKNIIFSYSANLTRKVIILESDTIYKKYIEFSNPDNLEAFSLTIKADYIISGSYTFENKSKKNYSVSYNIFNAIRKNQVYNDHLILDPKNIEKGAEQISSDVIKYFHPQETGFIKVITDFSNYELFADDQLIQNKFNLLELPAGEHKIKLRTMGYPPVQSNIILKQNKTNTLAFYNIFFNKNKAFLTINSHPADSSVFLNVKYLGNTPLTCTNLQPGKYRLKVIRSNYSDFYQNINLKNGTNRVNISLEKTHSREYYKNKHKINKRIMYTALGLGAVSMLSTYYFYASGELEYEKFQSDYNKYSTTGINEYYDKYNEHYNKSNLYSTITVVSAFIGIGSLTVSLIYFFKVINYDDVNIGVNESPFHTEFVFNNNNSILSLKYKF